VDDGTAWEVGYFFSQGKRIIGIRTDFRRAGEGKESKVNLMVERSCLAVATDPDQLISELKRILD
jgi:nucleoside 2-deoxyribosyltransferase